MGWKALGAFLLQHALFGAMGAVVGASATGHSPFSKEGGAMIAVGAITSAYNHWRDAPGWKATEQP